ncbi:PPK2 family polyphosphate:nucleotide phosphotransferase [Paraburkholderia sp. GV068]|jgi:PPK2 family polyphosphate:nucleotide phosphotransferase|uniref:PPK2 family polyphosphate kinase n=1 Tax=unclassified Paraburkholderia TaxID=2615204 RepID=UPI000D303841|nr:MULTISPECIES: PPK2 family polyphosphate kinase [unclassified Paraburkholderia]MBW8834212.1 polyphosphate kinase 2 family protein [Burkholderia sp.]PTQ96302.1 PPK2 family polyphosphate:nucleotide phosphotransferase [Paraburkholderia sp. GV072]PUA94630.1 PPK2 family polyphosphate:nucleotide phosphotransferase [Paraburkholderia sp. GV068]
MAKRPDLDDFRVPYFEGKKNGKFSLDDFDPASKPFSTGSKDSDRERLSEIGAKLDVLQERLHAQRKRRVLLVLQGMDTSGKDGTIRAVFHEVDPLGLRIAPFRAPTPDELAHDFLWRVHAQAPAAGELTIFNRSHYEDLLVPTVLGNIDANAFDVRCRHIRQFEELLADSDTTIIKCMLHISKEEQRERLQARVDDETKHWKFDVADLDARKQWDTYQGVYRNALAATSTEYAPWYVIPADSKTHRNVMVAELLLRTFQDLKLEFPPAKESLKGVKIE